MNALLLATVTLIYPLLAGESFEACSQKVGAPVPYCISSSTTRVEIEVLDGADYDFFVRFGGRETPKQRVSVPAKKPEPLPPLAPLTIIVEP